MEAQAREQQAMLMELEAALERVEQSLTLKEQEVRGGGREGGREGERGMEGGEGGRGEGGKKSFTISQFSSQDEATLIEQREVSQCTILLCVRHTNSKLLTPCPAGVRRIAGTAKKGESHKTHCPPHSEHAFCPWVGI